MLPFELRSKTHPHIRGFYRTLEAACREWILNPEGYDVVLVDSDGRVIHTFSPRECLEAASRGKEPADDIPD